MKYQKEFESFDHKKEVSTTISFVAKATYFLYAERRDRLRPALNEEVQSLCDFKSTSYAYLFAENMN